MYDDLGDHIGKYGKFDIKVNQRQLRLGSQIVTICKIENNKFRKKEPETEALRLSILEFHPTRLFAENRLRRCLMRRSFFHHHQIKKIVLFKSKTLSSMIPLSLLIIFQVFRQFSKAEKLR